MELSDRLRRETDWQERAFRLAGRHREELASALGTPPDIDRVPQSLWRKIEDDWAALLLLMLLRTAIENSTRHGHDPDRGGTIGRITEWASDLSRRRAVDFAANTGKAIEGKIKGDWNRDATNARGELGEMLETRARGLIETEFTTASVYGGEFGTDLAGIRHPEDSWKTNPHLSATGPCPVCAPLNGKPRSVWEQDFPSGPPAHPRCCLPGTPVAFPARPTAAYRSRYRGEVIEIVTRGGGRLTVTPNHPVLTPAGFVRAGNLREGQYAVGCGFRQIGSSATVPNDYQRVTACEDVFTSLRESRGVTSCQVPPSAEQFHGDGAGLHSDVHVVLSDRQLRTARQAPILQPAEHRHFSGDAWRSSGKRGRSPHLLGIRHDPAAGCPVCGRYLGATLFGGHAPPYTSAGLRLCPPKPKADQHPLEPAGACDAKFRSQSPFRFSSDVAVDDRLRDSSIASNPATLQSGMERHYGNPALCGQLRHSFASEVTLDRIVKIECRHWDGPVYDFEVPGLNLYAAGGVIVHNCVCEIVYVLIGKP